jgi:hypothetical protein
MSRNSPNDLLLTNDKSTKSFYLPLNSFTVLTSGFQKPFIQAHLWFIISFISDFYASDTVNTLILSFGYPLIHMNINVATTYSASSRF